MCELKWEWVENEILYPWTDKVLKYEEKVRAGKQKSSGKCLAMTTLKKEPKIFHIAKSQCKFDLMVFVNRVIMTSNSTRRMQL